MVNANDNPPRFASDMVRLEEPGIPANFPAHFTIHTLAARDPDPGARLSYALLQDPSGMCQLMLFDPPFSVRGRLFAGLFEVEEETGALKLSRQPPNENATYHLVVSVSDGQFTDFVATLSVSFCSESQG